MFYRRVVFVREFSLIPRETSHLSNAWQRNEPNSGTGGILQLKRSRHGWHGLNTDGRSLLLRN